MNTEGRSAIQKIREGVRRYLSWGLALVLALFPAVSGAHGLLFGLMLSVFARSTLPSDLKIWNSRSLGLAIVLMGAATPIRDVIHYGASGFGMSALLILVVLGAGVFISDRMGVDRKTGMLISSGTAICGGSAIAATGPAIDADSEQMGISVAVVFLLNAVSVLIFPPLGHLLALTPEQFGRFAALAIHDTSSVLAASVAFGGGAELAAVPMKLSRALWIIPVAAGMGWWNARGDSTKRFSGGSVPWFIPAFVLAALIFSFVPQLSGFAQPVGSVGKRLLVASLFLIGNSISASALKKAGLKPLVLGVSIWGVAILFSVGILNWF